MNGPFIDTIWSKMCVKNNFDEILMISVFSLNYLHEYLS